MAERGPTSAGFHITIHEDADIAVARTHVRQLGIRAGLSVVATHALVTAASEIVSNVVIHAGYGELVGETFSDGGRRAVILIARDAGRGIRDPERAMQDGYSTANGLGLGLSSARRLVDEFELISNNNGGTTVTLKKWIS